MSNKAKKVAFEQQQKALEVVKEHLAAPMGDMRLLTIRSGIRFEIATKGRGRLTAKAPKCTTILRKEFGLTGNRESLAVQFEGLLLAAGLLG
jgi:hypothetical protein